MTIAQDMKARASAELDRLVAEKEAYIRTRLAALGVPSAAIDEQLESCRPALAEQRAAIGRLIAVKLLKAAVPLSGVAANDRH
jgi:hypothetical protein